MSKALHLMTSIKKKKIFRCSGLSHAAGSGLCSNLWRDTVCQTWLLVGNNMEEWFGLSYMARWPMARANITLLHCRQRDSGGKKRQSWLMQHFDGESGTRSIKRGCSSCRAYLGAGHRFYCSGTASGKKENIRKFWSKHVQKHKCISVLNRSVIIGSVCLYKLHLIITSCASFSSRQTTERRQLTLVVLQTYLIKIQTFKRESGKQLPR